jgi:hypothetical protein
VSHMVIFRTPEGKPGYQPAETVEDAVGVVERLRNDEGVENVRIFHLEEVQFELRPYYKVELAGAAPGEDESESSSPPAALESRVASQPSDEVDEETLEPEDDSTTEVADAAHEVPPPPSAAYPPWAAPPPPPAPVQPPGVEATSDDDELSGAGQRRGLFGR